ncbi:MAG: hypothetical protein L6276_13480, partial [Acetobacterium sp.]|nr:hypothetical protein [Bacillota bacterium]MCG2731267.1 hypothetical protein [Acetobacterium sp.]
KENFWAGNVSIAANDSSLTSMISAKNIVIEDTTNNKNGNIVIGDKTNVIWDATNFWLDGELTTKSSSAKVTFKNINYLTTGNIDLDYMSYLTIEGAANMKNHIKIGAIKAVNSNDVHIKISNLCSFECDGIDLNWNSSLELDSSIIKINGNFNLVQPKAPLTLTCEYFDCIGKTSIYRLQNEMNFNPKNATLNIRFNGGYEQTNSVVNVNGADKVIFGNYDANNGGGNDKKIKFVQDNQHTLKLNVRADAIYLNSNTIEIPANGDFAFGGKNGGTTKTFNIKTNISGKVGNYSNVTGNKIEDLSGSGGLPYAPPAWPDPLVCSCVGGSSTTVTSSPGTETYY